MNKQILETIKELEIKNVSEEQSLEAANQNYTKKQLTHFIERHDLPIAKSWLKDEIVTALSDWMTDAQKELLSNDPELLAFYQKEVLQADEPLDVYNTDLSDSDSEKVLQLMEHGLVYNVEGELWVPEETVKAVSNDVESPERTSTGNESAPVEQAEADTTQSDSANKQPARSRQTRKSPQAASSSLSAEERLARNKKARLKYFKTQAKKKKGKKRK